MAVINDDSIMTLAKYCEIVSVARVAELLNTYPPQLYLWINSQREIYVKVGPQHALLDCFEVKGMCRFSDGPPRDVYGHHEDPDRPDPNLFSDRDRYI